MKSNLAWVGAAVLLLSGCVSYDNGYRTTGRVGDGYGSYDGQRVYGQYRTRIVEDSVGNIYRIYPDGTSVLISRGSYVTYPYDGYGGYNTYPSYGGYGVYGGYRSYPRVRQTSRPPVRPLPRPGQVYPSRPTPTPTQIPLPPRRHVGRPPTPPPVDHLQPPPRFSPRAEAAGARSKGTEVRRQSHRSQARRSPQP